MEGAAGRAVGWGAALVLIVVALAGTALDAGPAFSAKFGGGVPGTFTARTCVRDRYGCDWAGSFVSRNGADRRAGVSVTRDTTMDAAITAPGQRIAAVDTGDWANVYPDGGGRDWAVTAGFLVISLAALAWWLLEGPAGTAWRRRAAARCAVDAGAPGGDT